MKKIIFFIFFLAASAYSQQEEINKLNAFADSINSLIRNSSNLPGEIFTNTVVSLRNERAVGIQETRISYSFFQAEDSVAESDSSVFFIPVYNKPVKIASEYNIAASQSVSVAYYINGDNLFYTYNSYGARGYVYKKFWFKKEELLMFEERTSFNDEKLINMTEKFSKDVYNESLRILDNSREHIKLFKNLFKAAELDKQ